jgi:hypothetical protein
MNNKTIIKEKKTGTSFLDETLEVLNQKPSE